MHTPDRGLRGQRPAQFVHRQLPAIACHATSLSGAAIAPTSNKTGMERDSPPPGFCRYGFRSPAIYLALTLICLGLTRSDLGTVMRMTPSSQAASILSRSYSGGSVMVRQKGP